MRQHVVLALVVAVALAVSHVNAQEPPDLTPLGTAQRGALPFGGSYLMRVPNTGPGGASFVIVTGKLPDPRPDPMPARNGPNYPYGVPPEALDNMAGAALIGAVSPAKVNGFSYASIKGTGPGWLQVRLFVNGAFHSNVFYRFYDIDLMPDDAPATKLGLDVRYGSAQETEFMELGGPYSMNNVAEPIAEDLKGFDDRYHLVPQGTAWSGSVLGEGGYRTGRWRPEMTLLPLEDEQQNMLSNSYGTGMRTDQVLRISVWGPRESLVGAVPIRLHLTNTGAGSAKPGGPPLQTYDVNCGFTPPSPSPGMDGQWAWPSNVLPTPPNPPSQPAVLKRLKMVDQAHFTPLGEGMRWMLRIPWAGLSTSSQYADIELELQVPNPSWVWSAWGSPQGPHEGVMVSGERGTVLELERFECKYREPEDWTILKDRWVRRNAYALKHQLQVTTPDRVTLALGAAVREGQRSADPSWFDVVLALDAAETRFTQAYFEDEVMLSAVNRRLELDTVTGEWEQWIRAQWPRDTREDWTETATPASVIMEVRGYVGAIRQNPGPGDFDHEPAEPNAAGTTRSVVQHYINVLADANNNGIIDSDDRDEALEEGATGGAGVVVNYNPSGGTAGAAEPDSNLRQFRIYLSSPPVGEGYGGAKVWIHPTDINQATGQPHPALGWFLWKDDRRLEAVALAPTDPSNPGSGMAWVLDCPSAGEATRIDVWLGSNGRVQDGDFKLGFFVVCREDPAAPWIRVALDEVKVSLSTWGINVDSDNDGTVSLGDDEVEEEWRATVVVDNDAGPSLFPLQVLGHPQIAHFDSAVKAELSVDTANLLKIRDESGAIVIEGTTTTHEIPRGAIDSPFDLPYSMQGVAPGQFKLQVKLVSGQNILAFDLCACLAVDPKLRQVSFGGPLEVVRRDSDAGDYAAPHWQDNSDPLDGDASDRASDNNAGGADRRFPVCYVRDTAPEAEAVVRLASGFPEGSEVRIRGEAPDGMKFPSRLANVGEAGVEATYPMTAADKAFKDEVQKLDLKIMWLVSFDKGTTWTEVGMSDNRAYVTLAAPDLTNPPGAGGQARPNDKLFETLLDVGCRSAAGSNSAATAFAAIWNNEFKGTGGVKRKGIDGDNEPDGVNMVYWKAPHFEKDWDDMEDILGRTGADLEGGEASGRCTAWARLLHETLDAMGVAGSEVWVLEPQAPATHFLVEKWKFCDHITLGPDGIRKTQVHAHDRLVTLADTINMNDGWPNVPAILPGPNGQIDSKDDQGNVIGETKPPPQDDAYIPATKLIDTGRNGICNTTADALDVKLIDRDKGAPHRPVIATGPDMVIDSTLVAGNPKVSTGMLKELMSNGFHFLMRTEPGSDYGDVWDDVTLVGQGNTLPRNNFTLHRIVKYAGKYYDPSYGLGDFAAEVDHEDAAVAGVGYQAEEDGDNWKVSKDKKGELNLTYAHVPREQ